MKEIERFKALVVYWSKTGNTEKVKEAISKGMRKKGVTPTVKKVDEAEEEDLFNYDLVCIGAPSYEFLPPPPMMDFLKRKLTLYRSKGYIKPCAPKVQGKNAAAGVQLLKDALAMENAGCFAIVLEAIPDRVAQIITDRLQIPTIGIGAGPHCDGQNLVLHDMVGLFDRFTPKFVKRYANVWEIIQKALADFQADVKAGGFPQAEHSFTMKDDEYEALLKQLPK